MPWQRSPRSLRRRILLSFAAVLVTLAVLSLVLTTGGLYLYYRSTVEQKIQEASHRVGNLLSHEEDALAFRTKLLADIGRIEAMDLEAQLVREVQVYTLRWLKQDGVELVGMGNREYWRRQGGGGGLVQRAFDGMPGAELALLADGRPALVSATPREGSGGIEDVIVGAFVLDDQALETISLQVGAEIGLYGRSGRLLASSFGSPLEGRLRRIVPPAPDEIGMVGIQGEVYAIQSFPVSAAGGSDGRYAVFFPVGSLRSLALHLALWQGAGFAVALLAFYLLYRRLVVGTTDALESLTAWARHFNARNAVAPPQLGRSDEVGVLAGTFAGLAHELNAALEEVEVKNAALEEANLTLERNVVAKTREVEEQRMLLSTVFDGMPSAVLLLEEDGRLVYANKGAHAAFGEPRGQTWARLLEKLSPAGPDREPPAEMDWDGRHYLLTCRPLEPGGRLVVVAQDATERRALEEQLRQAQKLESVGRLAGGVAHDFNNVLGSIIPCVDLLRRRVQDPKAVTYLDTIEKSSQRAADVVRRLLAFSRSGEFRAVPLDLNEAVEGALKLLRPGLKDVRVDWRPDSHLPLVRADETQIQQAVINLALNAVDAMGGRGSLHLETRHQPGDRLVQLVVEDTGPGIPEYLSDKVFDPFFTTKEPGKGTGLGLSIVYGVMERHGGRVRLSSPPGRGARFELELPALDRLSEPGQDRASACGTLLAVDDDALLLESLAASLEDFGYRVIKAGGAEEALATLEAETGTFDAALLDVRMAGLDGPQLARRLRRLRPSLPILFMTGFAGDSEDEIRELSELPPLVKPFPPSRLVSALEALRRVSRVGEPGNQGGPPDTSRSVSS
jgi:signal transduction histidine kinase/CheY-like chemotaxis protein